MSSAVALVVRGSARRRGGGFLPQRLATTTTTTMATCWVPIVVRFYCLTLKIIAAAWLILFLLLIPNTNHSSPLLNAAAHRTPDRRTFYFITADDRITHQLSPALPFTRLHLHNIALKNEFFRGGTLWKIWKVWRWLPRTPISQRLYRSSPRNGAKDVVVFVDGDATFGGCALRDFVAAYDRIVKKSGCTIVASAEAMVSPRRAETGVAPQNSMPCAAATAAMYASTSAAASTPP